MGLTLVVNDFKNIFKFPKAICIGLINQLILLPIIGFLIVTFFDLPPEIAIGIMILAACPGGATSNLISFMAKADLALSVSLTAVSSIITVFTIPFIVGFSLEYFADENAVISLNILETIAQIFIIIVIPVLLGMIIRNFKPKFAERMNNPVKKASAIIFSLVVIGLILKERENLSTYIQQAGLATLTLNLLSVFLGYYSAKLFSLRREQAFSIAIESGIQNGTLAITISVIILENTQYGIPAAVYSIFMFVTGAIIVFLSRRTKKKTL